MNLEQIINFLSTYDQEDIKIMEVCGTHTASIFKNGIRSLLSPKIKLISGPGCPVCVTPSSYIDKAIEWSQKPDCVLVTFGDMMKVPGTTKSLSEAKAEGANVKLMYSPQEVINDAIETPQKTYIIACVGFETTTPTYALIIEQLENKKINNVKLLTALRRVLPALEYICETDTEIDGFIAPGHVSTVLGSEIYYKVAKKYKRPFAVAGFEAEHVLLAIFDLVKQVINMKHEVHNLYPSVVKPEGNIVAINYIDKYFDIKPAYWRGIGVIPDSGLFLKQPFRCYDAGSDVLPSENEEMLTKCRCGEVILGKITPPECSMFSKICTPQNAKGPCMVSSEGTCGIWYRFSKENG
ncbi:MAG: hydrogenase formation protein HypD [Peptococcaceae bacterium]|jgi:hydrogenase expression/formation protein HypD|nr:hydrogenase formation protein HypD [Peptococcaceae bacterium]